MPPKAQLNEMKQRLGQKRWKSLRQDLTDKGWNVSSIGSSSGSTSATSSNTDSKKSNKSDKTERYELPDGPVTVSAIINPELLGVDEALRVYVFSHSRHILADSTILDNGAAINLVNDKMKLEPGSFVRITGSGATVECGTSRLPIVGHGTRVLKGVFD